MGTKGTSAKRLQVEAALRTLSARQEAILAAVPDILMEVDKNKVYTWANPAGLEFFGEDVIGKEAAFYFEGEQVTYDVVRPLFNGREDVIYVESWQRRKDGEKRLLGWHCRALKDTDGNVVGALSSAHDITEPRQAEESLRRSQQETVHANRLLLALSQAAQAVQRALTTEEVYRAIQNQVTQLGYYTTGFEFAEDGQSLAIVYLNYRPDLVRTGEKMAGFSLRDYRFRPRADGIYHRAIVKGETIFVKDTAQAVADALPKRLRSLARPMKGLFKLNQSIFAPLTVGEETIGVLSITGPDLTEADNPAVTAFARQAAIAMQNARLYEQAKKEIAERKQAEEALRESESRANAMLQAIPDLMFRMDSQSVFLDYRADRSNLYAQSEPTLIGKRNRDITPPEFADLIDKQIRITLETGALQTFEYQLPIPGRGVRDYEARMVSSGADEVTAIVRDVTERKQAEESLRTSEERFAKSFHANPIAVCVSAFPDGRMVEVNEAFLRLTGYKREEVIGRSGPELGLWNDPEARTSIIRELLESGSVRDIEDQLRAKSGHLWDILASAEIIQLGEQPHALIMLSDITERKQAEQQRAQYSEQLEEMVKERTAQLEETQEKLVRQEKLAVLGQLAGGVGHELRSPLAVINNAIYYLRLVQPDADDKTRQYFGMIEHEVHTAEKIITDLLDFARIKSVDREPAAVSELVQHVLERYPVPESITAALKLPPKLPTIYADPRQIEQVLGNLVVNAYQAMASASSTTLASGGKLKISAVHRKKEVAIAVTDTGVGIPPENMAKLFEPLFTTKPKGIGLGLAVSKKLAEANGGRIEVQSEPGKGSTFTLYLPLAQGIRP